MPGKVAKKMYRKKRVSRKRTSRKTLFGAKVSGVRNYVVLNKINRTYTFKSAYDPTFSIIAGGGNPIAQLDKFKISQLARYPQFATMFRQIRVESINYRFTLLSTEFTDNVTLPTMYVRYNYDPTLIVGALSEDQMERTSNVVKKTFSHQSPESRSFNYKIRPCVMGAIQLFNSTNYVPSPLFNKYIDIDPPNTTDEAEHFGLQLFIPILAAGQQIQCTAEVTYTCRDLV